MCHVVWHPGRAVRNRTRRAMLSRMSRIVWCPIRKGRPGHGISVSRNRPVSGTRRNLLYPLCLCSRNCRRRRCLCTMDGRGRINSGGARRVSGLSTWISRMRIGRVSMSRMSRRIHIRSIRVVWRESRSRRILSRPVSIRPESRMSWMIHVWVGILLGAHWRRRALRARLRRWRHGIDRRRDGFRLGSRMSRNSGRRGIGMR